MLFCFAAGFAASAQAPTGNAAARVCPAVAGETQPPDFNGPDCLSAPLWRIDLHKRHLWIEVRLDAPRTVLAGEAPGAVYVIGAASSEVWVNGVRIGANGKPGESAGDEVPGAMDAVLFVPRDRFQAGENRIVLRASRHHSLIRLNSQLHQVALGPYADPTWRRLDAYWPALIVLSAFILGAGAFAISAWRGVRRGYSLLTVGLCAAAGGQLSAEIARGVIAYPYPFHEVRLILVAGFAAVFAAMLVAHVMTRFRLFTPRLRVAVLLVSCAIIAAAITLIASFDGKTAIALLIGQGLALAAAAYAAIRRRSRAALIYSAGLALCCAIVLIDYQGYLDRLFFYAAGALVAALLIEQVFAFARERARRQDEQARARDLAVALERAEQSSAPARLEIVSSGRTEYVSTADILTIRAAGDYAEIVLHSGRVLLHSGSLADLEETLPAMFLRVHRSAIVNTDFAERLERDPSGVGRLILAGGGEAPVSRRILPSVKAALRRP